MAVKKVKSKKSEKVEHREIGENAAREREKNLGRSGWTTIKWNETEQEEGGSSRMEQCTERKQREETMSEEKKTGNEGKWKETRNTEEGSWFRLCSRPRSMLLPWLQGQYRGALLLIIYVKDPSLLRSLERKLKREPP